jgi:hydrogenase maturation protein HypF
MSSITESTIQRRRLLVQGIVQGVGFRPFVYGQALRWSLAGFVYNDSQGVTIEVEGTPEALDGFQRALNEQAPPLARIDSVATELVHPRHEDTFVIIHSHKGSERSALISPDTATCEDCLRELFDPADRRYRYPFINCTNCGPRFTIVQDVPYDRDKTTMRVFPMCPACQAEYDDPLDRRFHAQPNACPVCGPQIRLDVWSNVGDSEIVGTRLIASCPLEQLTWEQWGGQDAMKHVPKVNVDFITLAAGLLAKGAILAIKGLGGYHLACDALDEEAVRRLRQRKRREARPFALMVPGIETAQQLCVLNDAEATLLKSYRRPIVLLAQKMDCPVAPGVAPACNTLGIMLPYTPLHYLLLRAFAKAIEPGRPAALVMTSGNVSDEPIAYQDDDARKRLFSIADGMLTHNRDIHMRCDDSVMRIVAGGEQFFRRSRGYAPEPVSLSIELPVPLLACGGHLKNTFCLGKGQKAFLSHHIGDLENLETLTSFREGIEHFSRLFDIYPQALAYDLHPEYLATKYALDSDIAQKIGVQHHHAHIASVMAEHGLSEPVIGVAADGTGFGTDGAIWGCEILLADLTGFERLAHLAYIPLVGGEQAVHQPWRVAATYLAQIYGDAFLNLDIPLVHSLDRAKWHVLTQMIQKGINSPPTSSLGRLFDAVAALLGLRNEVYYEGQAAVELEMLAASVDISEPYPFFIAEQTPAKLNVSPMFESIVRDIQRDLPAQRIAARFHRSIAELLLAACIAARKQTGRNMVALSGGVFQNRLLLEQLMKRLEEEGFQAFINRRVPPNDGGLSLGQLAVAAARLRQL